MNEQQPKSNVEAVGRVAESVVGGLQSQPMLLAVVVLNVIGIAAAVWFLHQLVSISGTRMEKVLKACMPNYTQQ